MDLTNMHIWFRQYAQQMGMQNVRAILPEQIDLVINTSIDDTVNQIIKENIGVSNDRIISDNSKIGQINALSTLYSVVELDCFPNVQTISIEEIGLTSQIDKGTCYYLEDEDTCIEVLKDILGSTLAQDIERDIVDEKLGYSSSYQVLTSLFTLDPRTAHIGKLTANNALNDYLYLVDFNINYCKGNLSGLGSSADSIETSGIKFITNYYPVRLIDDAYLADTLNDFILKPRFRSPVLTIYKQKDNNVFDLYIDKFTQNQDGYFLPNDLIPYKFRVSYIAKPQHVKYSEDVNVPNIECNLPDYLHVDILKHAVDLYRLAVGGQPQQQQTPSNQ